MPFGTVSFTKVFTLFMDVFFIGIHNRIPKNLNFQLYSMCMCTERVSEKKDRFDSELCNIQHVE